LLRRCGRLSEAVTALDGALVTEQEGASFVLRAHLATDTGSTYEHDIFFTRAYEAFGPLESLSDFALGWYRTGAETLKDTSKTEAAKAEQKRRREKKAPELRSAAVLPVCRQGMQLRMQFP
jgi:hypothetical protein